MYYCTLYMTNKRRSDTSAVFCLQYNSESDAQNFLDRIVDQARNCGATIETIDGYFYITGQLERSISRIFVNGTSNSYFIAGLENEETFGSKVPENKRAEIYKTDGFRTEKMMQGALDRHNEYRDKKQKKVNANLLRFSDELEAAADLKSIIRSVIKFARQDTDKEKLIDLAVQKIQNQDASTKTANWYDELSDLNK